MAEPILENASKNKVTLYLALTVLLTCFGSSMLYGYNMAVVNLPGENIQCFINQTILNVPCADFYAKNTSSNYSVPIYSLDAKFYYAQTNVIFVIAGIIGAFSSGWVADIIGRRNGLLFNHVFVIIGGIINGLTVKLSIPALLFLGRFLIGINSGVTVGLASMYLTEIAPRSLRGAIGACHQLAVTMGIVFGYILTTTHTFNTPTLWPLACACTAIPAFISLILLPFCPESPRFMFLKKDNEKVARENFIKLNQVEDVDVFIGELCEEVEIAKNQETFKFLQLFTLKDLRMPMFIACLAQVMQQLSGINAVIAYSSAMLETAGISSLYNQYCVIGIGILNVIISMASIPLIEKLGRRILVLGPSMLLAFSLLMLTITVSLVNSTLVSESSKSIVGGISVFFIMTYIVGFASGLGPIPSIIVAEIFRQAPRAAAYSVSQAIQWICNLIVMFSYPNMNKAIGGFSFIPFLVIVIACWIFFFLFMPETRNRTFDEVAKDLAFGTIVVGKRRTKIGKGVKYEKAETSDKAEDRKAEDCVELC